MNIKNIRRKKKLLLGNNKDFIELQKWADGVWRLIDETQGNKVVTKQDMFRFMFRYKYCLFGKRSERIVFDRGKAEHLLKEGWGVVDDKYNEYMYYDSHADKFVSSTGLLYECLPEARSYIPNIFQEKTWFKKEFGKEEKICTDDKGTIKRKQPESKIKSEWIAIVTTAVITLTTVAWSTWKNRSN